MVYIGSKARIAKEILNFILSGRSENQLYIEPFVGGGNVIQYVTGNTTGYDSNKFLIALHKALQTGWIPPEYVTREQYMEVKANKALYDDHLVGYIGFCCTYRSIWFGGFGGYYTGADGVTRNNQQGKRNNLMKQVPLLSGATFLTADFSSLSFSGAIIYCDPPYIDTSQPYTNKRDVFDSPGFWEWVRSQSINNTVYVSEKTAPEDFEVIWEKNITNFVSPKKNQEKRTQIAEKLFRLKKSN